MPNQSKRLAVSLVLCLVSSTVLALGAHAQEAPAFTPGNVVVSVEGCGVNGGTCTGVANGTGTGAGNSSATGYGDNQAAPLTLFQFLPVGATSATFVNSLQLPQSGSGANLPVSGEYGSSSEAGIQLSGSGQYLTIMGYGINANTFNANPDAYSAAPNAALAQSGSLTGQSYTPVPRVIALIDAYGNVNSATAIYNVFDNNNPRSVYTADGVTSAYISGQGTGCDLTGGVFLVPLGAAVTEPTAITGRDAAPTNSCIASGYTGSLVAQDTREVQVYGDTLYVSIDSTEGKSDNRSLIGTLGTPPATSLFSPSAPPTGDTGGPNLMTGFGNTGGTGKQSITAATTNGINTAGQQINISPESYFFASPTVLYVADSGSPKQTSATSTLGDGGLQKWVNKSGTWSLQYTLAKGLNLVANTSAAGTTGLLGLAGTVSGNTVTLYATGYTIGDLDPSYLFGITDTLTATANPGTSFNVLAAAPADSNFKHVSLAPSLPAGSATITSSPSGLAVTTSGTGCAAGTYTTPVTLIWAQGSTCNLSVAATQSGAAGTEYAFSQWQDGTTGTTDTVTAATTAAVYNASYTTEYQLTTTATMGGTVSAGGYYASGSNATVMATPSTGYYFVNFTGAVTSTSNPLTLAVTGPETVTANFAAQTTPVVSAWPVASPITYGQPLSASTLNGGWASVAGTYTFTAPATIPAAGLIAESVTFTPSNRTLYTTVTGTVNVQVTPAVLTVTANNLTKTVGAALPTLTASYSGFVNNDGAAVLSGAPALTTKATASSPAGTYPITVTAGSLSASNYSFTFVNGTLSVVAAPTVVLTLNPAISGSAAGGYVAVVTVTNSGNSAATGVTLTTATLGTATGSPLPQGPISIAAGGTGTFTVSFPGSAGADRAAVAAKFAGVYTGGSFTDSLRAVTLP
jgi:hypothetical protein